MSVWSKLGKGLALGGAALAAPFTGGGSLAAIAPMLSSAGIVLGDISAGRQQGQQNAVVAAQNQAAQERALYEAISRNLLEQAKFGVEAPSVRFNQALKGSLAANMQDVGINAPSRLQPYVVNFTGGLRPSAIGESGRQAGQQLSDLALAAMGKDAFTPPAPPTVAPLPTAGITDKLLGIAGAGTSILGALGQYMPQRKPQQPQLPPYSPDPNVWRNVRF